MTNVVKLERKWVRCGYNYIGGHFASAGGNALLQEV